MNPTRIIISPALATANNGNWQTAWRWSRMLRPAFVTTIAQHWNGEPFDVMLALHARRSADSIAAWSHARGVRENAPGLAVVLTGTDLYRDVQVDASAQASLAVAKRLVLLQECGPDALPVSLRSKACVIVPSTGTRQTSKKPKGHLRAVMVGHLREEKSLKTLMDAAHLLGDHPDILIDHIGEALDDELGAQARACAAECAQYRWRGGLSRERSRRRIQDAHVLINASRMEGGTHVVMEAMCSGTPVLASRIAGNVGMLGPNHQGYFEQGDARGLADLLLRCRSDQIACNAQVAAVELAEDFLHQLQAQCAQRASLFSPASEQAALIALVRELLP